MQLLVKEAGGSEITVDMTLTLSGAEAKSLHKALCNLISSEINCSYPEEDRQVWVETLEAVGRAVDGRNTGI